MKERLQKLLSARGIASRRKAEEGGIAGRVKTDADKRGEWSHVSDQGL